MPEIKVQEIKEVVVVVVVDDIKVVDIHPLVIKSLKEDVEEEEVKEALPEVMKGNIKSHK